MKTYEGNGFYEGTVYVLETLEDFDEYEKILRGIEQDFIEKYNPNFYEFKKDFEKHIGKIWKDKNKLRYVFNGVPVYKEYRIIAIEDDESNMDWYWVAQNVLDEKDIERPLVALRLTEEGFE